MYLNQISYSNFRCLEDGKIDLDRNFNLIYGKNGQGKTSFIEAVHFLATGKSFRTKKLKELFRYNRNRVIVFGKYTGKNNEENTMAIDVNEDRMLVKNPITNIKPNNDQNEWKPSFKPRVIELNSVSSSSKT